MPIRPQLPAQPNPNPNNKTVHQFETVNMPTYSLTPVPYNDIHLQSGKIVEPVIIEDVPSPMHEEGVNPQHLSNVTPIIDNAEHPTNVSTKTQNNTSSDTHPTQVSRKPPYLEILMLPKVVGQPQLNLLEELKNLYVKNSLLQALQDVPIYARTIQDMCTRRPGRKPRDPPIVHVIGKLSA